MAAGVGREPGIVELPAFSAGGDGPPARAGRRVLADRCRARQGDRAHDQPRRQGGRIPDQGAPRRGCRTRPGAGIRALRLHQRGHQQPQLRADAQRGAQRCCCRHSMRSSPTCAAWRMRTPRADAGAHAWPDRVADHRRQGTRRTSSRASPPARRARRVADAGQDQRRRRQLQRARRRRIRRSTGRRSRRHS